MAEDDLTHETSTALSEIGLMNINIVISPPPPDEEKDVHNWLAKRHVALNPLDAIMGKDNRR